VLDIGAEDGDAAAVEEAVDDVDDGFEDLSSPHPATAAAANRMLAAMPAAVVDLLLIIAATLRIAVCEADSV
jgi:hypothetical protein